MHDHNLDDLIIDTVAPKNNKAKGFLTIVALFIVIIIVMIILTRTFINPEDPQKSILEEEKITNIAPELKLQETLPEEVKKPEVAIEVPAPSEATATTETTKSPIEEGVQDPSLSEIIEDKVTAPVEVVKVEAPTPELPTPAKIIEEPKPIAKKPLIPVALPPKKVQAPKPSVNAVSKGAYYIQVGSYRQKPSPSFIARIKKNGFSYTLTKPNASGIKKLLIGPYSSRAKADRAIVTVKRDVQKQAFVVKK